MEPKESTSAFRSTAGTPVPAACAAPRSSSSRKGERSSRSSPKEALLRRALTRPLASKADAPANRLDEQSEVAWSESPTVLKPVAQQPGLLTPDGTFLEAYGTRPEFTRSADVEENPRPVPFFSRGTTLADLPRIPVAPLPAAPTPQAKFTFHDDARGPYLWEHRPEDLLPPRGYWPIYSSERAGLFYPGLLAPGQFIVGPPASLADRRFAVIDRSARLPTKASQGKAKNTTAAASFTPITSVTAASLRRPQKLPRPEALVARTNPFANVVTEPILTEPVLADAPSPPPLSSSPSPPPPPLLPALPPLPTSPLPPPPSSNEAEPPSDDSASSYQSARSNEEEAFTEALDLRPSTRLKSRK